MNSIIDNQKGCNLCSDLYIQNHVLNVLSPRKIKSDTLYIPLKNETITIKMEYVDLDFPYIEPLPKIDQ